MAERRSDFVVDRSAFVVDSSAFVVDRSALVVDKSDFVGDNSNAWFATSVSTLLSLLKALPANI